MVSPIETVIIRLSGLGFFKFLIPFILAAAVFYGLLRRSQIFGPPEKNVAVNGVVAMMIAFMIMASPIIAGVDFEQEMMKFFLQSSIASLIIILGLSAVGVLFPEGLAKSFGTYVKSGGAFIGIVIAGVLGFTALLITSGLMNVFFPQDILSGAAGTILSPDVILTAAFFILAAVVIIAITGIGGGGKGAPEKEK
jgi:hypothetical protein